MGGRVADDADTTPGGPSITALAGELADVVARLVACPVTALVEPDASRVHAAVRAAREALGVVEAAVLGRVEVDGRWATTADGRSARDFEDYLTRTSRGSRAGAKRQARLARAVTQEEVPGLAGAVTTGGVSLEHAHVLTRLGPTTPARRDALTSADPGVNAGFLLARAAEQGVEEFTREVKRWAAKVDPDADERGHRTSVAKTSCVLSERDDGVAMTAFMTPVDGAVFDTALRAVAGIPSANDDRTVEQRMGAALGDMARLVLDHGLAAGSSGGQRPHLSVTVTLDSLIAQVNALTSTARADAGARGGAAFPTIPPGWDAAVLADGTPIPPSVLARLACDAEVTRVIFGPDSQVLDVGRAERLYTGALRRAVIARDRHCAYPACTRPPRFGEIHHIKHWAAHGGETSVTNGVLLCWHHHEVVHSRHLRIRRNHTRTRWDFTEADGTPIPHPSDQTTDKARPPDTPAARTVGPDARDGRDRPEPDSEPDRHHEPPPQGRGLPPDGGVRPGRGSPDIPDRDADPPPASLFDDVA